MRAAHSPRPSSAFITVDPDRAGKQVGFVMIPHSPHDDAWGVTRVPIAVIKNGHGPTVILEGGNHGDEYEGPITICDMIRDLDPAEVQGRLILMPANNVHAVIAGTRTSPVDGLNFNRTFPGDPRGTITQQIAAYISDNIYPIGDAFIDLHSGGSSLDIIPSAIIEPTDDPELHRRNVAAVRAFDAPMTVVISNFGEPRTATAAACRSGLVTVGSEMGGGGTVSLEALGVCRRGVRNVLAHLGVLAHHKGTSLRGDSQILELPGTSAYVFASADGVFEPFHANGATVSAGQPAGRIHCTWDPTRPPDLLHYAADGILYGRRQPGRVRPGNCCLVVAAPYRGVLA
ncbi:succinylglutamate desuccinylase/aspartoacylase family protein [Microvirga brassicacearum]|uniref:Succinylglutamate desuccinylase n=1 Tax=Microvirga brassicacearum TaxID=2580413 RepID=A0A5N3PFW2_9HYPH|nr:succinylglutamate desuccinylase/aspartoacylase family protein [Microvirga brassicacearum]KAB0268613.1 succinylglutamate desuccinylase [Microvirga brassicacearum]